MFKSDKKLRIYTFRAENSVLFMSGETPRKARSPIKSPTRLGIPVPQLDFSPRREDETDYDTITCIPTLPLSDAIPRITGKTLADMLAGYYDEFFESLFIVDCRYNYEFEGGHIQGAVNINKPEDLTAAFFEEIYQNAIIVFHCEFSVNRGPYMAQIFRGFDRELNKEKYPELFYPNIYILDGGYKKFFAEYSDFCDGGYVPMRDEEHKLNGDLVKSTSQYRESCENLNKQHRQSLVDITNQSSKVCFASPASGELNQSPMTTKMLHFLASPTFSK